MALPPRLACPAPRQSRPLRLNRQGSGTHRQRMLRGAAGPLATFAKCRLVLVRTANGDGGLWSCGNNRRACVRACSCVCARACLFGRACVGARARAWVRVCPSCAPAEPHGVQPEAARARHQPGRLRSVARARRSFLQGADQERGRRCAALRMSKEPKG